VHPDRLSIIDIGDDRPGDSAGIDYLDHGPVYDDLLDCSHNDDNDVSPWVDGALRAPRWRVRL
jgi:hypothetical protein